MHYKNTVSGFEFGSATVERLFYNDPNGWVVIGVKTARHPGGVQIYVTKTGKVRMFSGRGKEWKPHDQVESACNRRVRGLRGAM